MMKTDERFIATLVKLAQNFKTTKSGIIRTVLLSYTKKLQRKILLRRIRNASLKTCMQARQSAAEFDAANADGI